MPSNSIPFDRVWFDSASSAGTGSITPGGAHTAAFLTPAAAGLPTGSKVTLLIENGDDWSVEKCTWSGTVFTRDSVAVSWIGGVRGTTALSVATGTPCRIVASAGDMYAVVGQRVRGLKANNFASANQLVISAQSAVLKGADGSYLQVDSPTATCNIATAGPAANGRDQSTAFSAGFIHFYLIGGAGKTDASIASATFGAPTLPSGYTHYAYLCSVYFDGTNLRFVAVRGATVHHRDKVDTATPTPGANAEQGVAIGSIVPPEALSFEVNGRLFFQNDTVGAQGEVFVGNETGHYPVYGFTATSTAGAYNGAAFGGVLAYLSNNIQWYWTANAGTTTGVSVTIFILNYRVPNGGE